jgi:hypothetical protein
MAKGPGRFVEQNAEEAIHATNYSLNWTREMVEQNLNQSRVFLENVLAIARKAIGDIDHQSSDIRHRSMLLAEETLSNSFDFVHRALRAREPQEIAQLQHEFVSRQAQMIMDQSKELGQSLMQKANEMARTTDEATAEVLRGQAQAA